jgi:hypothetical protein
MSRQIRFAIGAAMLGAPAAVGVTYALLMTLGIVGFVVLIWSIAAVALMVANG